MPAPLELDERRVRAVGLLVLERRRSARRRSARSARGRRARRRCARPPSGRRSPTARCRACGSPGSPTAPRSRRRSARRPSAPRGSAPRGAATLGAAAHRRDAHAPGPVRLALAEEGADALLAVGALRRPRAKPAFSASMPSSRSPLRGDLLDLLDRERRLLGEPARPRAARVSSSSWSGDDAVDEPELVGASSAPIGSPIRFISSALFSPTSRGRRCVPPKPGMIPSLISGWPKSAELRGEAHVAGHRELAAAAEREAVDRRDRRDCPSGRTRAAARAPPLISSRAAGLVQLREGLDVGARAEEHRVRRGDHERPHAALALTASHTLLQVADDLRRDRVHLAVGQPGDRDVAARSRA